MILDVGKIWIAPEEIVRDTETWTQALGASLLICPFVDERCGGRAARKPPVGQRCEVERETFHGSLTSDVMNGDVHEVAREWRGATPIARRRSRPVAEGFTGQKRRKTHTWAFIKTKHSQNPCAGAYFEEVTGRHYPRVSARGPIEASLAVPSVWS